MRAPIWALSRFRLGGMRAGFFVILALIAATLPAQAAKPRSDERRAVDLINRASSSVTRSAGCHPDLPQGTVTHDAPSATLLGMLGILRRPAMAEDSPPADGLHFLPATDVYADYIRVA